jgi:membrane protein DedA with SNARE-associated domain
LLKGLEDSLIEFLKNFYTSVGFAGVVVMMAIESMMIPLPSEIIMPLAGWLLVHNAAGDAPVWLQLVLAGFAGALGCLIGSVIAYWIGRAGGRPLVIKYGKYVLINTHHLEVSERWLARWGALAAFISRLLPVVRTFISLPMGVVRSPFVSFGILTFVGSFIWSIALAWIGYVLGPKFDEVRSSMGWLDYPIILIILGLVGWFVYSALKSRRNRPSDGDTDSTKKIETDAKLS